MPCICSFYSFSLYSCARILFVISTRKALYASPLISTLLLLDADIVCSRAKNHYDPHGTVDFSDSATQVDSAQAGDSLDAFRRGFKPLHKAQSTLMYFSVCCVLKFIWKSCSSLPISDLALSRCYFRYRVCCKLIGFCPSVVFASVLLPCCPTELQRDPYYPKMKTIRCCVSAYYVYLIPEIMHYM